MNVFWPDCIIFWTINIKNIAMKEIKDFISYQRNHVLTWCLLTMSCNEEGKQTLGSHTCSWTKVSTYLWMYENSFAFATMRNKRKNDVDGQGGLNKRKKSEKR